MLWKCDWLHASSCGCRRSVKVGRSQLIRANGDHRGLPCGQHKPRMQSSDELRCVQPCRSGRHDQRACGPIPLYDQSQVKISTPKVCRIFSQCKFCVVFQRSNALDAAVGQLRAPEGKLRLDKQICSAEKAAGQDSWSALVHPICSNHWRCHGHEHALQGNSVVI